MTRVNHSFPPFYDKNSEILILGSFPSVKSRELSFYYMHNQNRFWIVLEKVYETKIGDSILDKQEFLKKNHIALWDVIESCEINNSSDSSIKNIKVNNINKIIKETNITKIYTTGKKAYELYNKYILSKTKINAIYLYSPSPANCAIPFAKIVENYKVINKK